MGYTPVFDTVFQGSLCGKYPDLPVWLVLLAMAQKGGVIDAHPSYIATVSGIPQADIEAAIARFCEPDPSSRTPDHDGRRLESIPGRGFGWVIVNHEKYREKARKQAYDAERVSSGENRDRMAKRSPAITRADPRSPAPTSDDPLSDSDANKEKKRERTRAKARRARRVPEDFEPDRQLALAELPDIDLETEIQKFRDWEFKTPRSDWVAVWRTWIVNGKESGRYAKKAAFKWQ